MNFQPNDFLTLAPIPTGATRDYSIRKYTMPPGTTMETANVRCAMFGGQQPQTIHFPEETEWTQLVNRESGVVMSNVPVEQAQHLNCLSDFGGRVVVGGLGLGVAVQILQANPTVEEIVVVETSSQVARLVWPHIPHDKATLEMCDLMEWVTRSGRRAFDYAFYDIWQGDGERVFWQYVEPLRRNSHRHQVADRVVCWNEDVMRGQFYHGLSYRIAQFAGCRTVGEDGIRAMLLDPIGDIQSSGWSRPFFEAAVRYGAADDDDAMFKAAEFYVPLIGLPNWIECWEAIAETAF